MITNAIILQMIKDVVGRESRTLDELHGMLREAGSEWTSEQLRLFLECMAGVDVAEQIGGIVEVRRGSRDEREELMEAIERIARERRGDLIPAGELRRLLPPSFITTEEQIKALVKGIPRLELVGPGLIRAKD